MRRREAIPAGALLVWRGAAQVVHKTLLEMRQKFQRQMQAYGAAMELYRLQLPMEELRIRLLQDAGARARPSWDLHLFGRLGGPACLRAREQ